MAHGNGKKYILFDFEVLIQHFTTTLKQTKRLLVFQLNELQICDQPDKIVP